jgi:tetratricopeptide (TPR) repeat protein
MSGGRGATGRPALLFALLGLLMAAPVSAQEKVGIDAGVHDGFARIVFNWPAKVAYDAKLDGRTLTIHFARPLVADLPIVARRIDTIVERAVMSGDSTVVLTLRHPVVLKESIENTKVVVDLVDPPAKAASPPQAQEAAKAPTALTGLRVKVLDKDGARRLVFEWPTKIDYTVASDKGESQLRFKNAGPIDAARLAADAPDLAPRITTSGKDVTVGLKLPPGARLHDSRDGKLIVVDIIPDKAPVAAAKTSSTAEVAATSEAPAIAPPGPDAKAVADGAAGTEPGAPLQISAVAPDAESATFRFDWHKPVAMALFRRIDVLWMVFDAPVPINLADLRANGHAAVRAIDQVPHASATILRFDLPAGINPSIRRTDTEWVVELHRQRLQPEAPIKVAIQAVAQPPHVFFAMREPSQPIAFRDPEIGDTLIAVPAPQIGQGVAREERLVDFTALSSVQGVGLRSNSDAVVAKSLTNGVEVTSKTGLALSSDSDRVPRRSEVKSHLFNFSEWLGPKNVDVLAQRRALEQAIVAAPPMTRWSARLDLAHFYFAHGYAPEALGVIAAVQRNDPSYAADPRVKALNGATLLLAGDFDGAAREFGQPAFDDEPEVALWRGSLAYAKRDWQQANSEFAKGVAFLRNYPKPLRNRFALEAAEAAFAAGRHEEAEGYISIVLKDKPTAADRAAAEFLSARELQVAGDGEKASALLDKLAAGDDRPIRARAAMTRTLDDLEAGKITRPEAIEALDGLRFAWRGDDFELTLMRRLGELRIKDGDYRGGFDALRQAMNNFPDHPEHTAIGQQLTDAFIDVFIGPGSESIPPLKALSLYDEFKELTPSGSKGDEIVRKLADRLVAIDLLDRAADLLDNQVRNRLSGRDKARVATRLALVRLLDHKPKEALTALDIDVGSGIDFPLQSQRQQLRARALVELGRTDDALKILANDGSRDADRLRADIAWRTKNWAEAAKIFRRLAVLPDESGKLDDEAARTVLNLGTTLTLADDEAGLVALARTYATAMDASPYRDAFRILTGSAGPARGDIRQLADKVAQVNDLQSFMSDYRQKLATEKLSAIN